MNTKFHKFFNLYQATDSKTKDFIDSNIIGIFAEKLTTDNPKLKSKIIVITTNLLLQISTEEETLTDILDLGLKAQTTMQYFNNIKNFVDTNSFNITLPNLITTNASIQNEITETENYLKSLENIRTMASDQKQSLPQSEATFPSQQDNILTNKNSTAPTNSPRWGSDI